MKKKYNSAFSSTEVLILLFFLSVLLIAFSYYLNFQKLKIRKIKQEDSSKKQIELCFNDFVDYFKTNISTESDGPLDDIYSFVPDKKYNCSVNIVPLSGKLDINALPLDFFMQPYFLSLLKENLDISFIEDIKNKGKLLTSYGDLKEYITEEKFSETFCFLDMYNINTIDESILSNLCELYGCFGDSVSKKHLLSVNKQYVKNETEADLYYGIDYSILKPHITVEAPFNVNFMDAEFIASLVNLKRFDLVNSNQKVSELISYRNKETLDKESICNILGITNNNELYYYLGCKTYFWDVIVSCNNVICKFRIFRNEDQLYLINKRWTKK